MQEDGDDALLSSSLKVSATVIFYLCFIVCRAPRGVIPGRVRNKNNGHNHHVL
jgi:hypothetical protein